MRCVERLFPSLYEAHGGGPDSSDSFKGSPPRFLYPFRDKGNHSWRRRSHSVAKPPVCAVNDRDGSVV